MTVDKGVELSIWGSAEVSTTIIAASIPILRVFLREIRTNVERYHGRTGDHMTADNPTATRKSRLRTGNNTIVAATTNNMERGANVDDSSDRSILGHGKIMQKREINIETHSRSDGDETGYEMGRMHVDHAATYRPEN
jgi:hypothetical protein